LREAGWVVELRGYTYNKGQSQFVLDTLVENLASHAPKTQKTATPSATGTPPAGTPASAAAAAAKKAPANPLADRISHPLLYRYRPDEKPSGPVFHLIENSVMPGLVAGYSGPTVGPGGRPVTPRGRDAWRPVGMDPAKFGQGSDQTQPPEDPNRSKVEVKKDQHVRTEFIVLFIWREPIGVEESSDVTAPTGPVRPGPVPPGPRKGP
jgi:hypothetical protein